jgi:hypothetical protein
MHTRPVLLCITALLVFVGIFVLTQHATAPSVPSPQTAGTSSPPTVEVSTQDMSSPVRQEEISSAKLIIHSSAYPLPVGETLLSGMETLQSKGAFAYTGRNYPGLGFFVDAINAERNADGMYWVFYVNGVPASKGVSSTIVHERDVIEWKYEKGY